MFGESEWPMVLLTLGLSLFITFAVNIFFPKELKAVRKGYFIVKLGSYLLTPAVVVGCVLVVIFRDNPNWDVARYITIATAVASALSTMILTSQYRADKSDNIHFDKK